MGRFRVGSFNGSKMVPLAISTSVLIVFLAFGVDPTDSKDTIHIEPHVSEDTTNFLAPVNHVSDVKVNDGGSNTVTVMHSRGEGGVTKTRTVRINSNGVAADVVVIKKDDNEEDEDAVSTDVQEYALETALPPPPLPGMTSVTLVDPGLDARAEIANYNQFMDEIFRRMNGAIKSKRLDPMDLRLESNADNEVSGKKRGVSFRRHLFYPPESTTPESILILQDPSKPTRRPTQKPIEFEAIEAEDDDDDATALNETEETDVSTIRGSLHGMSTLKRLGDVSIHIHESHRTISCPFALGPLELKISKTLGSGRKKRTKSATATTDLMLGMMDLKIDRDSGQTEITNVVFDEPGGVSVKGSITRRVNDLKRRKDKVKVVDSPFKLVLASKAAQGIKKVARLVVASPIKTRRRSKEPST